MYNKEIIDEIFEREIRLIGRESFNKLQHSKVLLFGLGGVGSYVFEALLRAGVGNIVIVDKDVVDYSNINRQLVANLETVGKDKVEIAKERASKINPFAKIEAHKIFFDENTDKSIFDEANYVIDAIDTVSSKLEIIKTAKERNIKVISSMGTGNKLSQNFKIADISKTKVCKLAKVMRRELSKLNIKDVKVLYSEDLNYEYSDEENKEKQEKENKEKIIASISFVPPVAGLMIAGEVVRDIIKTS